MSDRMTPMPFGQLVTWMITEHKKTGSVFGVYRPYQAKEEYTRELFGRKLETPVGPAAGPHTQLAQNLAASYFSGSRFFELKTVQIIDGEDLPVSKPCILADDECYNCEWSTELYVPQAQDEYIKAWFLLRVMAKEFNLGAADGFQFNMSVGYDLEGIKSPKVNTFIDAMMEAKDTETFKQCREYLLANLDLFEHVKKEDIEAIPSNICNSATLSTLHGCPPQEIERIAVYLIGEKGLNTFIKCNPTLLGYEFARATMDQMGYDYVAFGDFHFKDDLQYEDAVPMLERLMKLSAGKGLEFGVKITNTFPVDVKQNELPSEEMYMSGKSLYPLSISLAAKLTAEFDGRLRISYSGGAEAFNIKGIVAAGIWPVTVATTLLKPGGYQRLQQLAEETDQVGIVFDRVDPEAAAALAGAALVDCRHVKAIKPLPSRKMKQPVPLTDCFVAPCEDGCPIHQDIPAYLKLAGQARYEEALRVITEKNPLPFMTGTICAHNCMSKCTRNFYEDPVQIRAMKLLSAEGGYDAVIGSLKPQSTHTEKAVAIIGGGPAGLSAAYFLSRAGAKVTIYEASDRLGGVVRHVIPDFRISSEAIEKDVRLVLAYGAEVKLNTRVEDISELRKSYDAVILANGAGAPGELRMESGDSINALDFLREFKKTEGKMDLGRNVVVIGGGNTAMDTARAVKKLPGVEHAYLVYRRTRRYMPADEEELVMALEDGVEFMELLAPKALRDGYLYCDKMKLGEADASGRRRVVTAGGEVKVAADTVIAAVGERVDAGFLNHNGINTNDRGYALVNPETLETNLEQVYVVGDGLNGPATIVESIRDALKAAEAIAGTVLTCDFKEVPEESDIYARRGSLMGALNGRPENGRCLSCSAICENCAEVCPNRANIAVAVPGLAMHQIVHVDSMCNECGNCKSFCPYNSAPYLDKFTLFTDAAAMEDSNNQGFYVVNPDTAACRVRYLGDIYDWEPLRTDAGAAIGTTPIPEKLGLVMETVCKSYRYLL